MASAPNNTTVNPAVPHPARDLEVQQVVPAHEIILCRTKEEKQQCIDIRIEVFHHEQKFPLDTELDELKEDLTSPNCKAAHFLLRLTSPNPDTNTDIPSSESSTTTTTPIGTIRAVLKTNGHNNNNYYYKLTRLAVLKPYRKFRFGRALVQRLHDWVVAHALEQRQHAKLLLGEGTGTGEGTTTESVPAPSPGSANEPSVKIITHSQIPVKAFYSKFGYIPEGDEFDEDGDPHQKMVLQLALPFQS